MLDKAYDPQGTEDRIYKMWEESGAFTADANSDKEPFTISMPPPNATGQLHLGHAVMLALEDIFIRYARMQGKEALWVPGTDHAAIATENVVIKKLQKEGMKDPREEMGREKLVDAIKEFVAGSQDTIRGQVRKMGSSCDWSRERYTMDAALNRCVNEVFCKMFADDLIYRGHRTVNWDPKLQTNVSDDEVDHEDRTDPFFTFQYGPFEIGTVRPETKFGDKYVVMHPDDERYSQYKHGDTFECEWINGPITATIIKDKAADPEIGTGVMTITPWHSGVDFEIAERHGLDKEQVIDFDGKLLPIAGEFEGMKITDARAKIVEKLDKKGLLVKTDDKYMHSVALNSRGSGVIEPQIKLQWFINVNKEAVNWKGKKMSLKQVMQDVIHSGDIKIIPECFEKTYFSWVDNLRDWCISRQIWWGHQIPIWYKGAEEFAGVQPPESSHSDQKIIFARHGESTGNKDKVAQGQDNPLTEKGQSHAKDLAQHLQDRNITKIISSRSVRAFDTAKIVADQLGLEVTILDDISAYDFGDIIGTPEEKDKPNIERAHELNTGESLQNFYDRTKHAWEKIQKERSNGDILVVSHRTNLSALDTIRSGGSSEDIVNARKRNENAAHGFWGEITLGGNEWTQDPDTLDTWFSSALWTWSTLIDPKLTEDYSLTLKEMLDQSPDYQKFHPTQVMETGYDIIFFWVARMILMTTYATGEIPFEKVYLHGMIRSRDGQKMSKSKPETMIDPLDIIPTYGADALRMSMIVGQSPGNDQKLFEEKIGGYRNFINKLWNASRFVLMQCEEAKFDVHSKAEIGGELSLADKALLSALQDLITDVTDGLAEYRLSETGEKLYSFTWDYFCDWYLELSKGEANPAVLIHTLRTLLTLLHPYCPFVTEELWDSVKPTDAGMLIAHEWPVVNERLKDQTAQDDLQTVIDVISGIRSLRSDQGIEPGAKISITLLTEKHGMLLESQESHIKSIARVESLTIDTNPGAAKPENAASSFLKDIEVHMPLDGLIDTDKETLKLSKEKQKLEGFIKGVNAKLENVKFVENAQEEVVALEREKLESSVAKLQKVIERLESLK